MSETLRTQVLVLGGGPGGYAAAIRAGQRGLDTVLVEGGRLGGVCLNRGCIPSKALIHAASEFRTLRRALTGHPLGLSVTGEVAVDWGETIAWKDRLVGQLGEGVRGLLRRAKVSVLEGWGMFTDAKTCRVTGPDGVACVVHANHVVLAAGSEPVSLPGLAWSEHVISSTEALSLERLPERLCVVGAGYIGLELGMALRRLGVEVCVVEAEPRILPQYDADLTAPVAAALEREGVEVRLGARALAFEAGALEIIAAGAPFRIPADMVLVSVGRRPRTAGYGLETMGVDLEGAFVKVDESCRTAMAGVWAIGDLVGEPMLAHKASAQGAMVADIIAGVGRRFDPVAIPAICFTDPEIVVVGRPLVASAEVVTATYPLSANGRALTLDAGAGGGFVRVSARADNHRVLGFAAVGPHVAELSGEMIAWLEMGAVLEDIAATLHAHPTQSEMIQDAALRALGLAIHI